MLNNYTEEWKPIPGFFGLYEASTYGRIRNTRGKILKTYKINSGYHCLKFTVNNVRTTHLVHRLVAITFLGTFTTRKEVNHIDGNKQNNSIKNLEWVTRDENMQHASINGLLPTEFRNAKCKLSNKQVEEIRKKYKPFIYTNKMLSEEYGVSITHIKSIIKGRKRIICEKPSGNLDS